MSELNESQLAEMLERYLLERYGLMVTGDALVKELGYKTKMAFRQSLVRRTVPVPIFELEHRRGKYALSKDIAAYLAKKRCLSMT